MPSKLTTQVYTQTGEIIKSVELNPAVFGVKVKEVVVHQVVVAQMANSRQVLAHTKDRSEVSGGGRKPWRQKGTGRARHGSIRSPLWVGGGITFGPTKDRNFSKKVNKKMKRKALFMCLSDKVNSGWIVLLDKLSLQEGKTKEFVGVIRDFRGILKLKEILKEIKKYRNKEIEKKNDLNKHQNNVNEKDKNLPAVAQVSLKAKASKHKFDIKNYKLSLLVILPKSDRKIIQAGRNLEGVKFITADSLNVMDLLKYEKVLMVEESLGVIERVYL